MALRSQSFHFGSSWAFTGPPTDPNNIASEFKQSCFVSSGKWFLCLSQAAPPINPWVISHLKLKRFSHVFRTLIAWVQTSSPMPSPGRRAILWVFIYLWKIMLGIF